MLTSLVGYLLGGYANKHANKFIHSIDISVQSCLVQSLKVCS